MARVSGDVVEPHRTCTRFSRCCGLEIFLGPLKNGASRRSARAQQPHGGGPPADLGLQRRVRAGGGQRSGERGVGEGEGVPQGISGGLVGD